MNKSSENRKMMFYLELTNKKTVITRSLTSAKHRRDVGYVSKQILPISEAF